MKTPAPAALGALLKTATPDGTVTVTSVMGSLCESWGSEGVLPLVKLAIKGTVQDEDGTPVPYSFATWDHLVRLDDWFLIQAERAGRSEASLKVLRDKALAGAELLLRQVDLSSAARLQ